MSTHGETITKAKLTYLCGEEVTWGGTRSFQLGVFCFLSGVRRTQVCVLLFLLHHTSIYSLNKCFLKSYSAPGSVLSREIFFNIW